MDKFIKGMDVSTLPEETALGAKYYDCLLYTSPSPRD